MIIVLKKDTPIERKEQLKNWLIEQNVTINDSEGEESTILGLIGDTRNIDEELIGSLDIVEKVQRVTESFKSVNRKFHPEDTIVDVKGAKFGGGEFTIIAGPCSVESEEQVIEVAHEIKKAGAGMLRGGAFKPRTSPYDFQGLKGDGLEILKVARKETGLPIVSEIMSVRDMEIFEDVDLIQIGARNMQNFSLLKEVGTMKKPILLKRGLASTLKELLMSAEYLMSAGTTDIILCERGIRTYSDYFRNTLDLSAVPMLHELSHFPVVVDPSHATGIARMVAPMALSSVAAGCDGLIIEVHNDPSKALCDGAQSLKPDQFSKIAENINKVREAIKDIY